MKKLILMALCAIATVSATKAQIAEQYYVYGVDFSHVKVHGATESIEQFANAFRDINLLFIQQPDKYDCRRMVRRQISGVYIEPIININSIADKTQMMTYTPETNDLDTKQMVKDYVLPQTSGMGIVLIAKLLNKPAGIAIYDAVLFDIQSRQILHQEEVSGRAGGFGLRNYWAGSVYNVIKSVKFF